MGKKTKSKARLDKYYHLSKEMGYRSRAAFKLIQLNKKYNFLSGATVLIDLCAAPGGWCQVASKEMPVSSIKIGIDLDPIKPIPGVTTFQCDITTEQCRHLIRKEIKHLKADVVLHDGAPNVGGQWSKDSYNQNELVLFSIKLAVEFLKEGGWFISKVFRSVDYNALIYVMRQLFNKVEATKPLASRTQAAEIFVICQGYKNPSYIDPKLLDPKYALKQIDDEDAMKNNAINSIKAIFDRKKNRSGYNTDTLFIVKTFKDFIECSNPFKFLFETHKIKVETEDCKKYIELVKKQPKEYELYFDDLQVLGKKEMEELVIWRNKIRTKLNLSRKEGLNEKKEEDSDKKNEKDEKDITKEMDEEILKYEKQRKKRLEAQKNKQEKIELSNKRAFILQEDQPHDNDVEVDENMFEYIQRNKIDIENLEEPKEKEEEEEEDENLGDFNEVNMSDLSEDDYIDMMNEDIEENKKLYEEEKEIARKKKKEKKEKKKKKGEIELVKNDNEDNEDDLLLDKDLESDEEEENEGDDSAFYDEDDEEENDNEKDNDLPLDEEEEDLKNDIIIKNPLRKEKKKKEDKKEDKKKDKKEKIEKKRDKIEDKKEDKKDNEENEEDNLSYDSDLEEEEKKEEKKLLNKKTNRKNSGDNSSSSSDSENDGYNSDDKAEIRAIAKKMLRKKERLKILNSSYNRYAFEDDGKVPKWFLEEESKHNKPQKPITKAEVLAEKEYLKKITVRMPKKVLEAKARKRNRLNKRLQKIKKQAENIASQDEYTELSKVKQIEKLYKREINRSKDKKKYIISRSWANNKGKDGRNVRHVDRRLKKDKRAAKAREKRNKKYKRRH